MRNDRTTRFAPITPLRIVALILALLASVPPAQAADEVVVYSSRNRQLIEPMFQAFTQESGIGVSYLTAEAGALVARLEQEGELTRADVLLTVDAGMLALAAESGLLAPTSSRVLERNVPEHLRDVDGRWFALTRRARPIVYHAGRVDPAELDSYAALADPEWRGRLCLASSNETYNLSLVAMLIDRLGEARAETVVSGWVDNLAARPFTTDSAVLAAIETGQCDLGIVNSYYYSRFRHAEPATELAIFWPDQGAGGVHENVSGAGMVRHAPHPELAMELLEWMAGKRAQSLFAGMNFEYPVHPRVKPVSEVRRLGRFEADERPIRRLGALQPAAARLMDRVEYR